MTCKVVVITGGTGGVGYQSALCLASLPEKNTVVVTGRSMESAQKAVASLKKASGNDHVECAVADLKLQKNVRTLAKELLARFPVVDELIHNAGNLNPGRPKKTDEGVDENFAVNVIAPLILTRELVPALRAAEPRGKVQVTSGGLPTTTLHVKDIEAQRMGGGLHAYFHSKKVMEAMVIALSRELEQEGIVINVVGGGLLGATGMTKAVGFNSLPWFMKPLYPIFASYTRRDDGGASAAACAKPSCMAVGATAEELGSGRNYMFYPKEIAFKKEVASEENQRLVMRHIEGKLVGEKLVTSATQRVD